ncbi:MAG: hypothetical protein NVV59_05195 [Chitinophagaceae bacterium]|nr:hypothetical protein [Chitinophagaceae bacterium]
MPSKKRIILLFVLLPLFSPVWSQEEFIEPPSRVLTTIPFEQLTGGVIIL